MFIVLLCLIILLDCLIHYFDIIYNAMLIICNFREGLMTYKQFIQELEDDILPAEAERRYVLNVLLIFLI